MQMSTIHFNSMEDKKNNKEKYRKQSIPFFSVHSGLLKQNRFFITLLFHLSQQKLKIIISVRQLVVKIQLFCSRDTHFAKKKGAVILSDSHGIFHCVLSIHKYFIIVASLIKFFIP